MKKYEHRTLRLGTNVNFHEDPAAVDPQMNKLGNEGWKLQTSFILPVRDPSIVAMVYGIFVREIPEK